MRPCEQVVRTMIDEYGIDTVLESMEKVANNRQSTTGEDPVFWHVLSKLFAFVRTV